MIWIKIDRCLLHLPYNLYICLCYIILSGSSKGVLVEVDVSERISNFIVNIANETSDCHNILICGDCNSRIGNEQDVMFDNYANID